ncbi:hypothetical protein GFC29_3813 (plasmid) [Anoxybacillus sp. B7M1]|uniref:hypothetical protein n=1 Tax=Anoxybacillus sp. B7M1 TaxID=1490057 RepID=UPI0007B5E7CD|nr:hypothetical protein [Anoxybacillus sp. B7M1]ANB66115.1 hypothetical protein GFC29_3813 [Anoxybacillus sp. B7M1]
MDNRRILGEIYPASVPKYSKRYAEERVPETAKRRVKELEITIFDTEMLSKTSELAISEVGEFVSAEKTVDIQACLSVEASGERITNPEITLHTLIEFTRDVSTEMHLNECEGANRQRISPVYLSEQREFSRVETYVSIHEHKAASFEHINDHFFAELSEINRLDRWVKNIAARLGTYEDANSADRIQMAILPHSEEFRLLYQLFQAILADGMEQASPAQRSVYEHLMDLSDRITRLENGSVSRLEQSERLLVNIHHTNEDHYDFAQAIGLHQGEIVNDFYIGDPHLRLMEGRLDDIEDADRNATEEAATVSIQEAEMPQTEWPVLLGKEEMANPFNQEFQALDTPGCEAPRLEKIAAEAIDCGIDHAFSIPSSEVEAVFSAIEELSRIQTEDIQLLDSSVAAATLIQKIEAVAVESGVDTLSLTRSVLEALLDTSMGEAAFKGRYVYEHIVEEFQRMDNQPVELRLSLDERVQKRNDTVLALMNHDKAANRAEKNVSISSGHLDNGERVTSDQTIFCEKKEPAEKVGDAWSAELQLLELANEKWIVVEANLHQYDIARIQEAMQEIEFAGYESFDRMMEHALSIDDVEIGSRGLEHDIVLSHLVVADHNVIENVIMSDFNAAIRNILEIGYVDETESGQMVPKNKKRIWLIPARPNFYSGWTWKKTR